MQVFQTPDNYPQQTSQPVQIPQHASRKKLFIAVGLVAAVAITSLIFFSSYIFGSPPKPDITSSTVTQLQNGQIGNGSTVKILPDTINYLANEIGAYKLHNSLTGEKPEIEVDVSDTNQSFTVTVEKNVPQTVEQPSQNPDIKIITDSSSLVKIFSSHDLNQEVLNYYKQGKVVVVVLKGFDVLYLKGYKDIYSSLGVGGVSGSVINLPFFYQEPKGFFL